MTDSRPAPYPSDVRAKGWRFELDYERIEQSDTWDLASEVPMAQPALLMMWMMAWTQVPCGSMPSDENLIRVKCRIPVKLWPALRPILMRGWWLADDGRLYHDTIATRVHEMLEYRRKTAKRVADHAEKKKQSRVTKPLEARDDSVTNALATGEPPVINDTGTGTGTGTLSSLRSESAPASTTPGEACKAMRMQGLADVNPSSPTLIALLEAGITLGELTTAAKDAADKKKPFAYALATAEGRRRDAAIAPLPAARGAAEPSWRTEQRERTQQAAPGVAAYKPADQFFLEVKATDVTPRRLG